MLPRGREHGQHPDKGRIQLSFVKFADRHGLKTNDALLKLQKELTGYPGVIISVDKDAAGPPTGKPINIRIITGDEILEPAGGGRAPQAVHGEQERARCRGPARRHRPRQAGHAIIIDRAKARRLNAAAYAVADAIRTALFGKEASTYRIEGDDDDYKTQLRLQDDQRYDVGTIMEHLKITFRDMWDGKIRQVPISAVAKDELSTTFSAIKRTDLKRVVTVSSNVTIAGYNSNEVNRRDEGRADRLREGRTLRHGLHRAAGGPDEGDELPGQAR